MAEVTDEGTFDPAEFEDELAAAAVTTWFR